METESKPDPVKWVWIVRAMTWGENPSIEFEQVFTGTREEAHDVYHYGERTVRNLRWSLNLTPADNAEFAKHNIDGLLEDK